MRSGRRRPSPGSGQKCLMGWKDVTEITKACPTLLKSSKLSWLATLASRNHQRLIVNRLEKMLHIEPVQMIDASGLRRSLSPSTRCQRPRLILHLQVLVPLVPLSSSTAVTTYAPSMRTSRNFMIACRKNL